MRPELVRATELLSTNQPAAIEEAIGLLQKTVYSFSMKVCGHPEDAEDTMQEVLYRSIRHLVKIHDPRALAVWLYTVTRNRCWRIRRKGSALDAKTYSLDELMPDDGELSRLLESSAKGPEDHLLQGEQQHLLHQAVLQIPPALRIVLVLHDMEELENSQVASILGLQEGTVRVRLHRARLAVRKEMQKLLDPAANAVSARNEPVEKEPSLPTASRRKRPAECQDLFGNLSNYLDGLVPAPACDKMQAHIDACPACVAFIQELKTAIDHCRSLQFPCDSKIASRLRTMFTQEYFRLLGQPMEDKNPVIL